MSALAHFSMSIYSVKQGGVKSGETENSIEKRAPQGNAMPAPPDTRDGNREKHMVLPEQQPVHEHSL